MRGYSCCTVAKKTKQSCKWESFKCVLSKLIDINTIPVIGKETIEVAVNDVNTFNWNRNIQLWWFYYNFPPKAECKKLYWLSCYYHFISLWNSTPGTRTS